ncbi:MAG: hypothetical protein KC592_14145 [Nitrospira sp.]|nr:hypothetical protein [Nitrospira sp.]
MKKLSIFTIMTILVASLSLFSAVSLVRASSPAKNKPGVAQDKMGNMEIQKKAEPGRGIDKMGNMEIQKKGRPGILEQKGNFEMQKNEKPRPGTDKMGNFEMQNDSVSGSDGEVGKKILEGN